MFKSWWKVKCWEVKALSHGLIQDYKMGQFGLITLPPKGKIDFYSAEYYDSEKESVLSKEGNIAGLITTDKMY